MRATLGLTRAMHLAEKNKDERGVVFYTLIVYDESNGPFIYCCYILLLFLIGLSPVLRYNAIEEKSTSPNKSAPIRLTFV